ncbi:MAG: hypothetical protein ACI8VI_001859 [Granulosicoccus sp.]|jgi:hypothetical protein
MQKVSGYSSFDASRIAESAALLVDDILKIIPFASGYCANLSHFDCYLHDTQVSTVN